MKKTNDAGYCCLRKFLRSSQIRILLRIVPNSLILAIANQGSDKLRKYGMFAAYDRFPFKDVLQFVNARVSE